MVPSDGSPKTSLPVGEFWQAKAAVFCPSCNEYHEINVWAKGKSYPNFISIGIGPGAGFSYRLSLGENRGEDGCMSVPVYRSVGRFSMGFNVSSEEIV